MDYVTMLRQSTCNCQHILSFSQFSCSVVSNSATPWSAACQAALSITNPQSLLKLMSLHSVMPSNHLTLCHPLLLPPSIFSRIRVFSNESALCIRRPKYWSFSFSISSSNEYPGPDLLQDALVGSPGSPRDSQESSPAPQIKSINSSVLQLSHLYMTAGKTIALTIWTFISKVTSLLFNMLSRFVIAFLPRSKHLLISWLQ